MRAEIGAVAAGHQDCIARHVLGPAQPVSVKMRNPRLNMNPLLAWCKDITRLSHEWKLYLDCFSGAGGAGGAAAGLRMASSTAGVAPALVSLMISSVVSVNFVRDAWMCETMTDSGTSASSMSRML